MTDSDLKELVTRLAGPVARAQGLAIWGVEISRAGRTLVRIFVDVPPATALPPDSPASNADVSPSDARDAGTQDMAALSASLDQCERISRQVALALEVEDSIAEAYVLEVSSPGLTRVFFSLAQMAPYVGDVVEARLHSPVAVTAPEGEDAARHGGPRRLWRGRLAAVEDDAFILTPVTVSPEGEVTPEALPPVRLPWDAVRRVSRVYVFRAPVKPGKGKGQQPGSKTGSKPASARKKAEQTWSS